MMDEKTTGRPEGDILKFYVTNIPEGCRPWDLATTLRSYGEIVGVYIARKRNKEGLIFGFVSFRCARNKEELISSLKNIRMGNCKLKVNVARFAAENGNLVPPKPPAEPGRKQAGVSAKMQAGGDFLGNEKLGCKKGRSYADILANRGGGLQSDSVVVIEPNVRLMIGVHGKALVGRTKDFKTLRTLNLLLWGSGFLGAESNMWVGSSFLSRSVLRENWKLCWRINVHGRAGFLHLTGGGDSLYPMNG
ncbi:putative RNA recognition motif domain, nucleotide-binding alpha-beta plait domain superfamily [Helianthus annuus]|nr:putative RNA recognition motif domain, nucleotide-binding alpha-beta plait domain superfamily [Helianthus annuus]